MDVGEILKIRTSPRGGQDFLAWFPERVDVLRLEVLTVSLHLMGNQVWGRLVRLLTDTGRAGGVFGKLTCP